MVIYANVLNNYKREFYLTNPVPQTKVTDDPYRQFVVAHLKMDGTDGGTTFTDFGPLNLTITRMGASPPTTSTAQVKYGTSSGLFSASNSYLSMSDANLALGTENLTVEFWGYKTANTALNDGVFAFGTSNANFSGMNSLVYSASGASTIHPYSSGNNSGDVFPINQWNHIAITREGTSTNQAKCYLNGVEIWTGTVATNYTQTFLNIGCYSSASFCWDGYIDSFRVTKGLARYTASFNPETATFL